VTYLSTRSPEVVSGGGGGASSGGGGGGGAGAVGAACTVRESIIYPVTLGTL
jgi:hypothetical protein